MARPSERLKALSGRFGSTELIELIGYGGMAAVYKAKDVETGRFFAVKVLDKASAGANQIQRFVREARIGSMLTDKNCVSVHGSGEENGCHYMIMDLVEGGDLKDFLKEKGGRLSWKKAAKITASIAEALAHSHSKSIIHRDLKPANVFLTANGRVCLGDFGLALIMGEGPHREEDGRVGIQVVVGTPAYMAPEQFRRPNGVDPRTDIYALGIVLYELLCGERPFLSDNVKELQKEHERKEAPFLSKKVEDLPTLLIELVDRLIAKKPDWRYESAELVAKDLQGIVAGTLKELTEDESPTQSNSGTYYENLPPKDQSRVGQASTARNQAVESNNPRDNKTLKVIGVTLILCLAVFITLYIATGTSKNDEQYKALCQQAKTAMQAEKFKDAEDLYSKAIKLFPSRQEAKTGLIKAVEAQDD
ncbi:MAG: protein kinase [Planctomycetota bacterium]|nr:protein kinase [Planctomycetota bacterium]